MFPVAFYSYMKVGESFNMCHYDMGFNSNHPAMVSFNSQVSSEGYFHPESPWLPGTRKVGMEPVELTPYTSTSPPASSSKSVSVSHLLVSWKGEQDKVVLTDISFEIDHVSLMESEF